MTHPQTLADYARWMAVHCFGCGRDLPEDPDPEAEPTRWCPECAAREFPDWPEIRAAAEAEGRATRAALLAQGE